MLSRLLRGGPFVALLLSCADSAPPPARTPQPIPCADCGVDLAVDAAAAQRRHLDLAADACEVQCVGGAGERDVLLLAPAIANVGDAPLEPGADLLSPARCGGGDVLADFVQWRVLDAAGAPVRDGASALGWAEDAARAGGCAFADLTGLPAGDYEIEIAVNGDGRVEEKRSDNNVGRAAFRIENTSSCEGEICGGACCPSGIACDAGRCALPDLIIDEEALVQSVRIDEANFGADDCAVEEGCVGDTGLRRLLRFTLATPNIGAVDLVVGDPAASPEAQWSSCHEHYHMVDFANYRLLRGDGSVAATGHKQAFCLMDTEPYGDDGPVSPQYNCSYQGISRGWSDSYGSGLDCQWVDVTGVPEGAYYLDIEINGARRYPESDYSNNSVRVPVYLPSDPTQCVPRDEVCHDGRDQNCDGVADDGCDPLASNDACANAWLLDGSGTWTGRIDRDTARDGGGSCGGAGGGLHFSLQVLSEEIVYLSTYGSEIDTVLRVEEGRCGEKSEIACSDDGCGSAQSHFVGALPAGNYDVIVQAREAGASGRVKLNVQRSGCSGARPIPSPGTYAGDTAAAGSSTRTSCGLGGGPDELWYFATCPGETVVDISTCDEGSFDTVLELRSGSCRGMAAACNDDTFEGIGCGPNGGSQIEGPLRGEGLHFLVVDGYLSSDGGPYRLQVDWTR